MARKHDSEYHKEKLLEALERSLGIVTIACKEVGLTRNTFYDYCKKDPKFKADVDDIYEIQLDFVENQLLKNIKNGDVASTIFYMKTKARKRGYSQNLDLTSAGEKLNNITTIKLIRGKATDENLDDENSTDDYEE